MKVAIIMGSTSDLDIMSQAISILESFGVEVVKRVISAHRTPDLMCEFAKTAKDNGIGVIIAGAGGAAHVAGVVAGMTTVPVIGVPIQIAIILWSQLKRKKKRAKQRKREEVVSVKDEESSIEGKA